MIHILDRLGLSSRLVIDENSDADLTPIDYSPVRKRLEAERMKSLGYLTDALEHYKAVE